MSNNIPTLGADQQVEKSKEQRQEEMGQKVGAVGGIAVALFMMWLFFAPASFDINDPVSMNECVTNDLSYSDTKQCKINYMNSVINSIDQMAYYAELDGDFIELKRLQIKRERAEQRLFKLL